MKRTIAFSLTLLMMLSLFTGCGAADSSATATDSSNGTESSTQEVFPENNLDSTAADDSGGMIQSNAASAENPSEKIIYSADAEIETTDFDATLQAVDALMERYGAFLEASSVNGTNYEGHGRRSASYTLRIPAASFVTVRDDLEELGNVTYYNLYADNITTQYYDAQSRLAAYETEEARLLEILASCETVEEMIAVESQLTEVRYQIESLTTTLRTWQNQVDYSTLTLWITEVKTLTEQTPASFGEDVRQTLQQTFSVLAEGGRVIAKYLIVAVILLALPAAIVLVIVFTIRRNRRKKQQKVTRPDEKKESKE